ncbi:hypothetical protein EVAR_65823_1 [Eumeta japonica]|uniref:Uncharacterized protein n=1 Tax=Eumeta variegata TaxID=151549 RepID=A0A4C1ZLR5_EUMVA|nr:hypothetical protein EVAR_65823_1 [Eumeta japonica]
MRTGIVVVQNDTMFTVILRSSATTSGKQMVVYQFLFTFVLELRTGAQQGHNMVSSAICPERPPTAESGPPSSGRPERAPVSAERPLEQSRTADGDAAPEWCRYRSGRWTPSAPLGKLRTGLGNEIAGVPPPPAPPARGQ